MDTILLIARLALAAIFATAAIGKLMDLSGSVQAVTNFGVPARFARPIGYGLPIIEILVAILLIPVSTAFWGALLGVLLLLAFIAGMVNSLRKGEAPDCHCFGAIHSEPISRTTIIRNGIFVVLGLFIMAGGTTPGASVVGWLDGETGVVKGLVVAAALLAVAVVGLGWMTMHLLGQNGRLLIRMDEIEAAPRTAAPAPVRKLAPAFTGTGMIGDKVTLDTLKEPDKPILLFFSDPGCGPCNALLPDIGRWQSELTDTTLAVVTRGTIDQARDKLKPHDIKRVAIENERAISNLYGVNGTPAAVLIDKTGYVASDVAGGADNIRKLVDGVKSGNLPVVAAAPAPPPPAPAVPRGIAVGEAVPDFDLPGRGEETVTTAALRDDPHVLVFWNPGCGFCKRLQPDLHEWAGEYGDGAVSLVLITSGNEEQANEYTFARQIGFDQGFNTGRLFGASGTPSGVLINADGTVGSQLAVGGPSIMELLRTNSQARALKP